MSEDIEAVAKIKHRRSRNGCLTCRKRKKRCDETRPVCQMCHRLELKCNYPVAGDDRRNKRRKVFTVPDSPSSADPSPSESSSVFTEELALDILSPMFQLQELPNRDSSSIVMPDFSLSGALIFDEATSTTSMVARLQSNFKELDQTSIDLYTYFCDTQSQLMSVSPQNQFKSVFANMAIHHEPVLYALLAWAAFHKSEAQRSPGGEELAQALLDKAVGLVSKPGCFSFAVTLASLVIIMTAYVCQGHVSNWRTYMEITAALIKEQAAIGFNWNDEEVYWPLKVFAYMDVLAYGNRKRTLLLPKEIHDSIMSYRGDELPDSLCASCHPIFLILASINQLYGEMHEGSLSIEALSDKANELLDKLRVASPDKELLLPLTYMDAQDQINLFKVFQQLAIISVHNLLLRMNAACIQMQLLNKEMIRLLSAVVGTKGEAALVFPFFLAGVTASHAATRTTILNWFEEMHGRHSQRNIRSARTLLREVWARDEQGTRYIDWNHLAELKGWNMNFG